MASNKKHRYGPALAEQVAASLLAGHTVVSYHRDYCGMGLAYKDGVFLYGEVWDGQLQSWNTHENRAASLLTFQDRAAFVAWLSQQSDATLSRREMADSFYWNNQPITQQRLAAFVAGLTSGPV